MVTLTKWEPFGLLRPERFRRLLDFDFEPDGWKRVEELRQDGDVVVRAELPGIDPEKDVDVSVADGMLHIEAHREEREELKDKYILRSEFRYGEFTRDLKLPEGTKKDSIRASYKDGILEVRILMPETTKEGPTKVKVSHS